MVTVNLIPTGWIEVYHQRWQNMANHSGPHGDGPARRSHAAEQASEWAHDLDGLNMEDHDVGEDLEPGETSEYTKSVALKLN